MLRKIKVSLSVLCIFLFVSTALAHSGRTDAYGGHYNRRTGEYHYHNGGYVPRPSQTRQLDPIPQKKPELIIIVANGIYYVRVVCVVDGDTIEVRFNESQIEKVRLIGVDTPETVHPQKAIQHYGKEASDYTKKMLANKKVWLQMDVQIRDNYQRLLAYVWLEKPINREQIRSQMYNAQLLLEGYGQVMTIQPNSRYAEMFTQFQKEARENGKGLWGQR